MGNKRMHNQGAQEIMTDYERNKMLRVQENQERLRELGVKNIAKSLTSLAVAGNTKKRQKKAKVTNDKDADYNPEDSVDNEENYQEVATHVTAPKKLHRRQYIAPMSMNRYANLSKQRVSAPNISRVIPCANGVGPVFGLKEYTHVSKNMHTAGPKSFARIREDLKNKDPNKEPPTLTQMFECTRERTEGNVYVDTYDDTADKIEQMKNYKPPENESSPTDPFLAVMNKEYDGHRRLFGRGVTNTLIKKVKAGGSSNMAASDIVRSSTTSLEAENGQHDDKYRKLEEVYEQKIVELKEDNEKKLELMRKEFVDERANLVEDTVRKILEKLPPEVARMVIR